MAILGAFMVPHPPMILSEVGKGREKDVEETILAYEEVAGRIAKLKPETIVISSPHATMYLPELVRRERLHSLAHRR